MRIDRVFVRLSRRFSFWIPSLLIMALIQSAVAAPAQEKRLSLSLQDVELSEVMSILSRQQRVNILVSDGVEASISINLFDVDLDEAIQSIVDAAGYAVELRNGSYFIVERENAGKYSMGGMTTLRTFRVNYSNINDVEKTLKDHLSRYGSINKLAARKILVVEDLPPFVDRIEKLLQEIDSEPKQILIEAKVLQVTLRDNESFGLDWTKLFSSESGEGSFGTSGLSSAGSGGFFFELVNSNIEVALDALKSRGRLRTLSTPKLLALENREASTQVGDRIGYKVTTTINQVTTESIEFLESGIILRVTSSVDAGGKILMEISPEVSSGSVSDDGVPSKNTTQVETSMLVPDGKTVFIGGLIKQSVDESREGVPVLGDVPGLGLLFSNRAINIVNTETIVLITPKIVGTDRSVINLGDIGRTREAQRVLASKTKRMKHDMAMTMGSDEDKKPIAPIKVKGGQELKEPEIFNFGEHN